MKNARARPGIPYACLILAPAILAIVSGCASVKINKIDPKTGNIQTESPEGLRYYLPRPYLSVFEPFIVSSEVYLANGELSADSNYVLLTQVPRGLDDIVSKDLQGGGKQRIGRQAIDASRVIARAGLPGGPQGAPVDDGTEKPEGADKPKDEAPKDEKPKDEKPKDEKPKADEPKAKVESGILNFKATNDNQAFAVTPQPRYFNILWLPDFDEQYVVTARAGLGNAGVVINMGQGWSMQGLDAKVDNSALVGPLIDLYSKTLSSLQKLATAKIEAPLALLKGGPQGAPVAGDKTAKTEFDGGTPVTVKVTKVRIVAPGLYPILKPNEVAAALSAPEGKRILEPKRPFTNIAFNTYDVIVIEAARSTGDSALRIQQYVDSTLPTGTTEPANPGGGPAQSTRPNDLDAPARTLNALLSSPAQATKTGEFFVAKLTRGGDGKVSAVLRRNTGATGGTLDALPDDAALKSTVTTSLKASGIDIAPANITITRPAQ